MPCSNLHKAVFNQKLLLIESNLLRSDVLCTSAAKPESSNGIATHAVPSDQLGDTSVKPGATQAAAHGDPQVLQPSRMIRRVHDAESIKDVVLYIANI